MRFLTKERSFYKTFVSLWGVLVLNNVIVLGVNLADNIMLGAYSEPALSGAAACNQLQFIFQQVIFGLGNTAVLIGSQYWGEKKLKPIKNVAASALICGLLFSLVLFAVTAVFPYQTVGIFTESDAIKQQGVEYLNIIKYTYPVFAVTNILLACLRSVESVKVGFRVSLITLVVNISLNYVLIFGKLGFEPMGAEGAALATLISRIAELLFVIIHIMFLEKNLKLSLRDMVTTNVPLFKKYVISSVPFVLTDGLFGVSTALQTVILGHMSDAAIAANSVATTLYQVLKVAAIGSSAASAVMIGKSIGQGKTLEKIKEYSRTLQLIYVGVGITTSVLLFFLRTPIIGLYNISNEASSLANGFLLVLCITCIGTAYQMPTNTGIVRGGGDSKFVLKLDIVAIWCIVLPLSFCAAFIWHWHPIAVIACLNADQVFKCIPVFIKANSYNWIKKVT